MTARHVSLLRGINVGGHNLVAMARLRGIYESIGCEDVTTYLQSGNVLFRRSRPGAVGAEVGGALRRELGLEVKVLSRTHADLARIVAADPFPGAEPNRRFVLFLSGHPAAAIARDLGEVASGPDRAILVGREFHLHCPDGIGNSKLPGLLGDRRLGVTVTGRNWRTVTALLEQSAGPS